MTEPAVKETAMVDVGELRRLEKAATPDVGTVKDFRAFQAACYDALPAILDRLEALEKALHRIIDHADRHEGDPEGTYPSGYHFADYSRSVAIETLAKLDKET